MNGNFFLFSISLQFYKGCLCPFYLVKCSFIPSYVHRYVSLWVITQYCCHDLYLGPPTGPQQSQVGLFGSRLDLRCAAGIDSVVLRLRMPPPQLWMLPALELVAWRGCKGQQKGQCLSFIAYHLLLLLPLAHHELFLLWCPSATLPCSQPTINQSLYKLWAEINLSSFNIGCQIFCLRNEKSN